LRDLVSSGSVLAMPKLSAHLLMLTLIFIMIRQTASLTAAPPTLRRIKVAILGSGMSGVTVASTLLDEIKSNNKLKLDITIYEAGRGIGGRMSTRYTGEKKQEQQQQQRLQFDHGCQYIGPAKTDEFKLALHTWNQRGWIKEWKGKFGRIVYTNNNKQSSETTTATSTSSIAYEETTNDTIRYVGYPRMNSICENIITHSLLDAVSAEHLPSHQEEITPSTLTVITNTRIQHATSLLHNSISDYSSTNDNNYFYKGSRMWQLAEKKKHNTTTTNINEDESLVVGDDDDDGGYYDWLVLTDLSSARSLINMHDNDNNDQLSSFITSGGVGYIPVCTTMITLNQPLTSIPVDGIEFSPNMDDKFGSLGWMARDSSKPGRRRNNNDDDDDDDDKRESWVLQSTSQGGKAILDTMKGQTLNDIREGIRKTMVNDFTNAIPHLLSVIGGGDNNDDVIDITNMPTVIDSVGHRWGAAFPINAKLDMNSYIDTTQQLVVCGDYFGARHGRVEGAFQSGRSAAQNLIRQL